MDPYVPQGMNSSSQSPTFTALLNSHLMHPYVLETMDPPPFTSQMNDAPEAIEERSGSRKERRKWTPQEDIVLCNSWLNTSKDAVISNEQKHDAFWKRVAAYFNASPNLAGYQDKESIHCKHRWQRINDSVCKFVGCHATASRQQSSGQNDDDVMRVTLDMYFQDQKVKFSLQHCWIELRNDQKWCALTTGKGKQSSKRRKLDQCIASSNAEEVRPMGVKAAKATKKKAISSKGGSVDSESNVKAFEKMWTTKEKDLATKERVSKVELLECLIAKKEPLSDIEMALKSKLISEMLGI